MSRYTNVLVILGYFFSSMIVLNKCKKIAGYKFPVYSLPFCPRNESEWNNRSLALICNNANGYTCLPNEKLTELVEFCYTVPWIWIEEGSYVDAYNCSHFIDGCHNTSYQSRRIFDYPACISLGYGCFLAEQSCKSSPNVNRPEATENDKDDWLLVVFVIGIIVFITSCISFFILYFYRKRKKCFSGKKSTSNERTLIELEELEERKSLMSDTENGKGFSNKKLKIEKDLFDQWKHEDLCFISTMASTAVEKIIKTKNLVIVTGHSGSGKSAIIQHIALKYREQGWRVKRVKKIQDIMDEYSSSRFEKDKTICVFNDPFGKESFDEILNNSWQTYEEELKLYLQTAKLMMSCRNHIISDARLTRNLVNQSHIVDIDDNKNKLSVDEKRKILTKYTFGMNLSETECEKIVEVERYFPLLCKLYSSKEDTPKNSIGFFTETVTVLQEEILGFRTKDKNKYCALALLVLYNNDLCVGDLLKKKDTENKFKHTLNLCGVPENTPPSAIGDTLNTLKGFFVKKIGDTYQFYHDLVMEATTHLFGTNYPAEIIKYADIGFLRRRVRFGNCDKRNDPFTIYLKDKYIEELEERLFTELFGERLLDVVLNPCLKNANVIKMLKGKIADHPENIKQILETKKITVNKQELYQTSSHLLLTKTSFLDLENEVSPLFALIVFCHTQLSHICLDILKQMQINISSFFPAVCCNGSTELFCNVFKDQVIESLSKTWGGLFPIHIVSVFHNYKLLNEMIKIGADVNLKMNENGWTPLTLAAGNDTEEYENFYHRESGAARRDKTVQILLSNGADINQCLENGASPLFIACIGGHNSTIQLLLNNGADINLCVENGASPLYIACHNRHDSTVQLLLHNGANTNSCTKNGTNPLMIACDNGHINTAKLLLNNGAAINLCMENGGSPLYAACQMGHNSTVHFLLNNGANINLCMKDGASPLFVACQNGHESTVQLLLNNGADMNLCYEDGASPLYVACQNGHDCAVKLLLNNKADINCCKKNRSSPLHKACHNGHDSTVKLLLDNGADIDLCTKDGYSPLFLACQQGHASTAQLLLNNGADVNLCTEEGASPLFVACQKGHDKTIKLLVNEGANINLCMKTGASPLSVACQNGYDSIVLRLLNNAADVNPCEKDGLGPLYLACQNGHDSIVQLLLNNDADINLCGKEGLSPFFVACKNEHNSTLQLLLKNGADINLCPNIGTSPLFIACQNGYDKTVPLLLTNGADVNLCMTGEVSPLYIACQNGHDSIVALLLNNGADTNLCLDDGASPLYVACQMGHESTVQRLLNNGADVNLCMENGARPLYVACQMGHHSIAQLLRDNGAV
nr:ankyrin-3 isoform X2 [Crassostrea gigas]